MHLQKLLSIRFAVAGGALATLLLAGCSNNQAEGTVDNRAGNQARAEIAQKMGTPSGPNARPGGTTAPTAGQQSAPGMPAGVPIGPPR